MFFSLFIVLLLIYIFFFFFQAEDGIRDYKVTGVQTCALPILVAYTEPNSPATAASINLARGAQVLAVDGVDLVNATDSAAINTLNAGLFQIGRASCRERV